MATESATAATVSAAFRPKRMQFSAAFPEVIAAKVVFDEDSIAAGATSQGVFTIPGVAVGDIVFVTTDTLDQTVNLITGKVTAANTVTVDVQNQDLGAASTVLSASPVLRIVVLRVNAGLLFGN